MDNSTQLSLGLEFFENNGNLQKSFHRDDINETTSKTRDDIRKSKGYYKRTGTPGNYKYYYTKGEYEKATGERSGRKDSIKLGSKVRLDDGREGKVVEIANKVHSDGTQQVIVQLDSGGKVPKGIGQISKR